MDYRNSDFSTNQDTMFLQENRERLVKSIADQIYSTIISKSSGKEGRDFNDIFNCISINGNNAYYLDIYLNHIGFICKYRRNIISK